MLFVTSFGISTFHIIDKNQFYDILIEKEIYKTRTNSKQHDPIAEAIKQAGAEGLPMVSVGNKIDGMRYFSFLNDALKMIEGKTAVVFSGEGENQYGDAAVIVVGRENKHDEAYACIEVSDEGLSVSRSRIGELYAANKTVKEALGIIEACIAVKHALSFDNPWGGNVFIDTSYNDTTEYVRSFFFEKVRIRRILSKTESVKLPDIYLLPLLFRNESDLVNRCSRIIDSVRSLKELSVECMKESMNSSAAYKIVSFVVESREQLKSELELFLKEKENWNKPGFKWNTVYGSCFFASPIGSDGKICFINPPGGMFSKVPFYRFFSLFPMLKNEIKNNRITCKSRVDLINRYYFEIVSIFLTIKALLHIGIKLDSIIGGSLGEISIPLVLDSVESYDTPLELEKSSPDIMINVIGLLEDIIENQPELSRSYFKREISDLQKWYVLCPYEKVKAYIDSLPAGSPIFIIIIGSPNDIVICGEEQICKKLINELKCYSMEFKDPVYAHTPILDPEFERMKDKISALGMHIRRSNDFDVYGTYVGHKLGYSIEEFAENYSGCLIKQVDLPTIFRKAYEEGNRIFIDLGSSAFCNKWAKESLKDCDVYVFSPYEKITPYSSILSIAANLWANRISFDRKKLISWYSGDYSTFVPEEAADTAVSHSDWKTDFWNKLLKNQIKRNEALYDYYLNKSRNIHGHKSRNVATEDALVSPAEKECLYNYSQILEMTDNSMSNVLGEKYRNEDKYPVRARMPLPPFMFVSRITDINAEYGKLNAGSYVEAEFDITDDCILKMNDYCVSSVVFSEAAHVGIFLMGYMGLDDIYSGKTKFRITDVITKYPSDKWPVIGDTIRLKFCIKKVIKNGYNVITVSDYKVYLEDELIIDAVETGGFFTQDILDNSVGIINSVKAPKLIQVKGQENLYYKICSKTAFSRSELENYYNGDFIRCFGNKADSIRFSLNIKPEVRFADRILEISESGGRFGLGYLIAEKEIGPDFWAFKCHFKNDPVLPGTIMLDGLVQMFTFFQMYVGLFNSEKRLIPKMKTGLQIETKFRGEVKKACHTIKYQLDIKMVEKRENGLLINSDGLVYCDGVLIIEEKNISSIIAE